MPSISMVCRRTQPRKLGEASDATAACAAQDVTQRPRGRTKHTLEISVKISRHNYDGKLLGTNWFPVDPNY